MNKSEAKKRIEKLREVIRRHRYEYHVLDKLSIPESALDQLKHELYKLEQQYPEFVTPDSPTQRVAGEPAKGFKKVHHRTPMLSMEDVFSEEEAEEWLERLKRLQPRSHFDFFAEIKMDGLAVALIYEDGEFTTGATRGNGRVGEDVTHNLRTINAIPLRLRTPKDSEIKAFLNKHKGKLDAKKVRSVLESHKGRIEIRGEAYMTKSQLAKLNKALKKEGKPELANPRNAAAGSIRQLDPVLTEKRGLDFFGYTMVGDYGTSTHEQSHEMISLLGLPQNPLNRYCKDLSAVKKMHSEIAKKREKLDYWTDGVVVNVNADRLFEELGVVGKAPRGMIAWKFPAEQGTTVVEDIQVSVGRTGVLTPVAVLKPVQLQGTTVTHASLHNEDEIKRLGLKIGDTVIVEKAGDIIPKVIEVLKDLRTGKEKSFRMPKKCPMCGSPVRRKEGEVAVMCTNTNCFAKQLAKLLHLASAFEIDGIGEKIAEQLLQNGLVSEPADLFTLEPGDFLQLEGFADVSSNKLANEIRSRTSIGLDRFIYGLGIRHVGGETASLLARHFGDLQSFRKAERQDLEEIEGIGEVVAQAILDYLSDKKLMEELERLLSHVTVNDVLTKKKVGPLSGTTWVFTGTLDSMTRDEAKDKVRDLGGDISESVSKKTSFVVVGDDPGSKFDKAKKLGVEILDEKQFLRKI